VDRRIVALHKTAAKQEGVIGLAGGLPADELLPRQELASALAKVAALDRDALQYGWAEGDGRTACWW
jgi:DNA-binding transcriptional MocR family regulator